MVKVEVASQKATATRRKRKYDSQKAARTRQINKERRRKGLPTLAEEDRMKKPRRAYKYTMMYSGKSGKYRKFKGELGENAAEWREQNSKYKDRVKKNDVEHGTSSASS
jgi:hypothetical protein